MAWSKGKLRRRDDITQQFRKFHRGLSEAIRQHGDKRLADPERSATEFLDGVMQLGIDVANKPNPVFEILLATGIAPSEIGPDTTFGDVGDLAVFRKKLLVLNRHLGLPWPELKARVTEARLPSGVIQSALAQFRPDTLRRKGSDLTDGYLACLSAYADVTYMDKRTHEAFRRARQKSEEFVTLVRRVEKASDYQQIMEQLSAS